MFHSRAVSLVLALCVPFACPSFAAELHLGDGMSKVRAERSISYFKAKMPCKVIAVVFAPNPQADVYHVKCDMTGVKNAPNTQATFDLTIAPDSTQDDFETAVDKMAEVVRVAINAIEAGRTFPRDGGFEIEAPRKRSL